MRCHRVPSPQRRLSTALQTSDSELFFELKFASENRDLQLELEQRVARTGREREREREHLFKRETEHLCLRQLIHGIGGGPR